MTYTFKLARRLAVSRPCIMMAILLLLSALCVLGDPHLTNISPQHWMVAAPCCAGLISTTKKNRRKTSTSSRTPRRSSDRPRKGTGVPDKLDVFRRDVQEAERAAFEARRRANRFLAGGVMIAAVGVGLCYLATPEPALGEALPIYLRRAAGPVGMVFTLEALAWFFLGRYEVRMEEYKSSYRSYLERKDRFNEESVMAGEPDLSKALMFARALAPGDRGLSVGQTASVPEPVKAIEPNPIFGILQAAVERWASKRG